MAIATAAQPQGVCLNRNHRVWRPWRLTALVAVAVISAASVLHRTTLQVPHPEVALGARDISALDAALAQVATLRAQVESGKVVAQFGQKAQDIVANLPGSSQDLEEVLDEALLALFVRQIAMVGQRIADSFEQDAPRVDSLELADAQFLAEASELVRPSAKWSQGLNRERVALCARLMGTYKSGSALTEERARAARAQQVTVDVIGRLQYQMELLQQKAQGIGSSKSPWVLSSSYRIPNTPLQLVGKYEQGRADIELNLSPEKDPSTSEGGFAQGVGPASVGVSFNVGF